MNEPEAKLPVQADEIDLEQELTELRRTSSLLLIALVVLSVTFTSFLWLQARRSGNDLRIMRQQAQAVTETSRREGPAVENFVSQLMRYGQTHPEFQQVLNKYNIRMVTNAGPTGAGPVPAER